ncbi:L,D-transpeptidase family protein, partial [Gordonibacter urolithinfaciens]|uniref:L,D-transpeptidase family protein n=1 Tax=Gordonibacter urolithinfaciens TaxID=1335613 RepID=UPI003AB05BB1
KRYFYGDDGAMLFKNQFLGGSWYWFDMNEGFMWTGSANIYGRWYRYDLSDGHMLTGSQYIDGHWYWYDLTAGMMLTGSQYIDGHWYWYDLTAGIMLTGSQYIDGDWYWYDLTAGMMLTGSQNIYGNWYWYDLVDGRMLFGWQDIYGTMTYYDKKDGIRLFESNHLYQDWKKANGMSSPTKYLILVDTGGCYTSVFKGSRNDWTPLYDWRCSPGAAATPTPKGYYSIKGRGYSFGHGYTCYYWTQFYGDYLFHTILYYPNTFIPMEGTMGVPASQGCVRLEYDNAKWLNQNIPNRTTVYIY